MNETVQTRRTDLANPGATSTQLSKRKRVLIAESDGFTRMVLMLLFRMIGFGVDFTSNGLIALSKLRSQPPDALLLELNLTGLAGLELIRWVRNDPQFGNLRIYVFTDAEAMKRNVRKEVQLSVTKVFDKRSTTREDVVKNIILDLSSTEVGIRLHTGSAENRTAGSSRRMVLPGEFDQLVQGVRAQADRAARSKEPEERLGSCRELLSRVSSLRSCAEMGGLRNLERQARGLAGFLNQLCRERKACTDSRLNTVRSSVEVLGALSARSEDELAHFSAVIVDESSPSGKSLSDALTRMGVNAFVFADAPPAIEYLGSNPVNLIVVNVPQPERHGLDEASLQRLPLHETTPVIFISDALADQSKGRPGNVPLVNQNPLLLHEIVLLALNQVHNLETLRLPQANQEHAPSAAAGRIPFGNEEEAEASEDPGSATFTAVPPQNAVELQAWGAEAPAEGELSTSGSQAENWTPEEAASGNGEDQAALFVQNDQTQNGDVVAEEQSETPFSLHEGAIAEDLPPEQTSQQLESSISDLEPSEGGNQQTDSESGNPEGFVAGPADGEGVCATEGNFQAGSSDYDVAASAEPNALSSNPEASQDEELHALQEECVVLRAALGNQENDRQELVNRVVAAENDLQYSQAQVQEYQQALGDLQKQLEEAKARQPDAEVTERLQQAENELSQRGAQLDQARSQAEAQGAEHERLMAELRGQIAAFEAEVERLRERCAALEKELTGLRHDAEAFNSKLVQEQQANAEAAQRIGGLEKDLSQRAAEAERARTEAERARTEAKAQAEKYQRTEDELRRQLEAAVVARKQSEAAHQEVESRIGPLEAELADLRESREQFDKVLKVEQETSVELRAVNRDLEKQLQADKAAREAQTAELEQQVAQGVTNLARVTAALANETGERRRSDERAAALNLQLQELHAQSGRFLEGQRADHERIADLEAQLRQRDETISRCSSELEQHKSEGRLVKEQLQKTRELNAHFRKNLSVFKEAHQKLDSRQKDLQGRFEGALDALEKKGSKLERESAERQRLAAALEAAQGDLQAESRKRESLEAELRSARDLAKQQQSKAEREQAQRKHLQQALESARVSHSDRSRRAELELGKAQAALEFEQVERKRRETQLARMRLVGLEATRRARLLRNTLQKQTREPLDNLYQSARRLLQLELGEDQKKLAETMLQDALLVRTRLQEPQQAKGQVSAATEADQVGTAEQPATDEFSTKFFENNSAPIPLKEQ